MSNTIKNDTMQPISIYFRKDSNAYFDSIKNIESFQSLLQSSPWETKLCADWNELSELLQYKPHQIIFHIDTVGTNDVTMHEFIAMIETLVKVTGNEKIPMAVGIEKSTPLSVLKEFQKSGLHGIVPSAGTFGPVETIKGIEALYNRIPYWPKHILDQLTGAKKSVIRNTIILTPRQVQVVDLISERGLSNKKIAQALNITESTVKIHVSAILKCYGVRTRTQLALVANK